MFPACRPFGPSLIDIGFDTGRDGGAVAIEAFDPRVAALLQERQHASGAASGIEDRGVTSLSRLLGRAVSMAERTVMRGLV